MGQPQRDWKSGRPISLSLTCVCVCAVLDCVWERDAHFQGPGNTQRTALRKNPILSPFLVELLPSFSHYYCTGKTSMAQFLRAVSLLTLALGPTPQTRNPKLFITVIQTRLSFDLYKLPFPFSLSLLRSFTFTVCLEVRLQIFEAPGYCAFSPAQHNDNVVTCVHKT